MVIISILTFSIGIIIWLVVGLINKLGGIRAFYEVVRMEIKIGWITRKIPNGHAYTRILKITALLRLERQRTHIANRLRNEKFRSEEKNRERLLYEKEVKVLSKH